jgi:hypothetical protein
MQMSWQKPDWYITPEEFASVVIESMEEIGYFKRNEPAHPEDIVVAFTSVSEAVAKGAGMIIRKVQSRQY